MLNVKQEIPTFKAFWSNLDRESNSGLPAFSTKITKFLLFKGFQAYFSVESMNLFKKVVHFFYKNQ